MAKKDKAARLPKKVGGVKLPKQFRKSASVVAELAQNPIAREVVSAALVAGATALAKRKVKGTGSQPDGRKSSSELDGLIAQGKDVGNMFAQGVTAFFGALLKPPEKAATAPHDTAPAKPATARTAARRAASKKPAAAAPTTAKPVAAAKRASARPRAKPAARPKPASTT